MEETILLSYLNGELSDQESEEVEEWVDRSDENHRLLEQVYYTLTLAQRSEAYEAADVEAALKTFRSRVDKKNMVASVKRTSSERMRLLWQRYGGTAAAFLGGLILAVGVLMGVYGENSHYEVSTAMGQRARVILPDGTSVWLNSSTQLSYESGWLSRERKAYLKGEAYFEVKRNVLKPFVVSSQGVRTQVLGTKFNVRARESEHKVATTLLSGSVQMYCGGQTDARQVLKPGETMVVDTEKGISELYAYNCPEEVLLWIKGDLCFTACPLGKIAESLSKVYNVKFTFSDSQLKEKRFTCLFKTDSSLEEILSTLALTQHFSYSISDTSIRIFSFQKE